MVELMGDSARGDDFALVRLRVDRDRIVDADAPGVAEDLRGLTLLDEATASLSSGATLAGDVAFRLYDTYGFPLDLTQDALKARGMAVDTAGFAKAMEKQKEEARASWAGSGDTQTEPVWFKLRETLGATEFLGYETENAEAEILALVRDGDGIQTAKAGESVGIVVNQTPFYAESGGQSPDEGLIASENGGAIIDDVQKRADGLFVHYAKMENGTLSVGDAVRMSVDHDRRAAIRGILLLPAYWLLMSLATYRALIDLALRPHHWEKTPHRRHVNGGQGSFAPAKRMNSVSASRGNTMVDRTGVAPMY